MSKKFKLEIELGNDAFVDAPGDEIARILRNAADTVEGEMIANAILGTLRDINGNVVGAYSVTRR